MSDRSGLPWRHPAVIVLAFVVAILPMLLVRHLPLIDFPNHLARFEIRNALAAGSPLSRFYEWHWGFIPTLGLDLLVVPLNRVLPVEAAGNLALTLAALLLCVGTMALDRALNGPRWGLSLFTGIILYCGPFRFGFASFIIGTSLALPLFALWVVRRPRWGAADVAGFSLAGVLLILVHLYAFGLYAVCVACYEASLLLEAAWAQGRWRIPPIGRSVGVGIAVTLPLVSLLFSPTSADAGVIRWSTLHWKAEAVLAPLYFNQPRIELPLLAVVVATVGLGLLTGTLRLHPRMILAMLVFAALEAALPRTLFGSNYADYRLPSGVAFFLLASLRLNSDSRVRVRAMLGVLTVCLVVRVASITVDWLSVQPVLEEYRDALAPVPPGSRVLVIRGQVEPRSLRRSPPLEHVPVLAAARQQAFTGYTFPNLQSPLTLRPEWASYQHGTPDPDLAADMGRYDYLLAVQNPKIAVPPWVTLVPLKHGQTYVLSRIDLH